MIGSGIARSLERGVARRQTIRICIPASCPHICRASHVHGDIVRLELCATVANAAASNRHFKNSDGRKGLDLYDCVRAVDIHNADAEPNENSLRAISLSDDLSGYDAISSSNIEIESVAYDCPLIEATIAAPEFRALSVEGDIRTPGRENKGDWGGSIHARKATA